MTTEERAYWVAFNHIRGVGSARVQRMIKAFGDLRSAWEASRSGLSAAGLDERTTEAIVSGRSQIDPELLLDRCAQRRIRVLIWEDADYPVRLKELPAPPPVLYLKGTLCEADNLSAAVVGTRKTTAYGREVTRMFASALASSGVTVVSGMARGIDSEAHTAALERHGRTLAVFGCGVDVVYPPEHARLARRIEESGALLSDYPPGTPPDAVNFPPRNRIIAGLSMATLVVEAGEESGALLTASYAADYGRDVFAVPGSVLSESSRGCNRLIASGAQVAVSPEEFLCALDLNRTGPSIQMRMAIPDSPVEAKILSALSSEPTHIDLLKTKVGLPVEEVSGALAMMELKGMVRPVGGMQYIALRTVYSGETRD
ncbi:MAG: DNA-processing protein DprA [Anaerolineales bacterium]|jgi:DNA processing protein